MEGHLHDATTGQFVSKNADPATSVFITEDEQSVWLKEWLRIGRQIESDVKDLPGYENYDLLQMKVDQGAVAAVIHAQILKSDRRLPC